jgi:hypothetical protein
MALILKDRVQVTSTTTGTGTFTLGSAVAGFQDFSVIGDGNTTYYVITNNVDWEVGLGTYTSSGTTLSRDSILESSNSGNAVDWTAGTKNVFVTYPAEKAVTLDGTETLTNKTLTSPTLTTPALGTPASGNLESCTADGTNAVGFKTIPQNSQSAAYTLVAADSGKHILHPSADTTARTFTIPANSSVPFPIGTAITFINQNGAGVVTIAITTDTMRLSPAGTTGSRTLAANGSATAIKITSTEWIISGSGLT